MADRAVYRTNKATDGDITALCGPWGQQPKSAAIQDIEFGTHSYHVPWQSGRTEIRVVNGPTGKYLRTDADTTTRNNLLDLPDC